LFISLKQLEILESQGITLTKLSEDSLELLRNWRNTPEISDNMEFREYISKEEQALWFKNLCLNTNYYFIISYHKKKIGLIHLNNFDTITESAHAGLFIAEKEYVGTGVSLGASLLLLTFAFENLELKIIYAKVKRDNLSALKYNTGLGFIFDKHLNNEFSLYHTTKADFDSRKLLLAKLAQVI
jgi:UDP-4-amino-4,6-dideoxy-N-acetyl-beta-L-altrosamine N-acetyltransferase